ncbi:hypothetical protein R3X28_13390 [Maribacter sp. TH_r10]|uniref:hypothetical protein n=1 Tax=Maribacter sp. TH_r10 TaxID=3082086 RepID=UPI00295426BF|nr:hypothetical protein [Maribacter sp. TH_r10]MDV7139882.1 hypothetical protein [Maribacter sp. TH_r10]
MKTRTKLKIIGFLLVLTSTISCSESDQPIGKWDDNIKLSQKKVQLSVDNDSIVITTEGSWWWIDGIYLNDTSSFDRNEIDTTAENFVIDETVYRIERKNATEIYIEMTKNETGIERKLMIALQAGNYFDSITVSQSSN